MSRKILIALLGVLLVAALVGAGTLAQFSDTETSTGNTFTAGTLNLAPGSDFVSGSYSGASTNYKVTAGGDGVNGKVVFGGTGADTPVGLKPGENGSITWSLKNTGTQPGYLDITSAVTFGGGTNPEPEQAAEGDNNNDPDLDDLMGVKLTVNDGTTTSYLVGTADNYAPMSLLQGLLNGQTNVAMAADGTRTYILSWSLASDLKGAGVDALFGTDDDVPADDNIIQGDTAEIDIEFELAQTEGQ
jgi:predicted ribosomally synthesized peptide with SipW-like signal peptide